MLADNNQQLYKVTSTFFTHCPKKMYQIYGHRAINSFIPFLMSCWSKHPDSRPWVSFSRTQCAYNMNLRATKKGNQRNREIQSGAEAALDSGLLSKLTFVRNSKKLITRPAKKGADARVENASGVPASQHPSERKEPVARTHNDFSTQSRFPSRAGPAPARRKKPQPSTGCEMEHRPPPQPPPDSRREKESLLDSLLAVRVRLGQVHEQPTLTLAPNNDSLTFSSRRRAIIFCFVSAPSSLLYK